MILKEFGYKEFENRPTAWSLDDLNLEKVNLLVGKNATGKTNTITKIRWLANILSGSQPQLLNSGNYTVKFTDGEDRYCYTLQLSLQKVIYERLSINDEEKFIRNEEGEGKIKANQFDDLMNFKLSPNQLVVVSKRDAIQHPYIENIIAWAEGVRIYSFSSRLGQDTILSTNDMNNITVNPKDANSVVGLYVKGNHDFPSDFRKQVMSSMKKIGYDLTDIDVVATQGVSRKLPKELAALSNSNPFLTLYVGEKNSNAIIFQNQMSQGMFRALSLIIQVSYNVLTKLSSTILVDDIGEGLDYERSTNMIKLLMDLANKNNIQLVMSTNDRFVMNNVPLEYWQVIQRNGGICKIFNYQNSKEKFDEFKFTGLSNFDFFKTDFLNQNWETEVSTNEKNSGIR